MPGTSGNVHDISRNASSCAWPTGTLESMMREVRQALGDIDFQHEREVESLRASRIDDAIKNHILERLLARRRARRHPYEEVLVGLRRRQHRQAFAA
jgi:hypothetical protein